jgi:hypothetical protein
MIYDWNPPWTTLIIMINVHLFVEYKYIKFILIFLPGE